MKKIWYSRVLHTASKPFFSALEFVLSGNLRVGTLPLYNKKGRFGRYNTGPLVRLIRQDFVQVYNSGVRPLLWWSFTILRGSGASLFSWCRDRPFLVSVYRDVLKNCSVNRDWSALRETWTVRILDCFHGHWQSIEENKSLTWPNDLNYNLVA